MVYDKEPETPYADFTPLHHGLYTPISKTQKGSRNLTGKVYLFIIYQIKKYWGLFIGFTKSLVPSYNRCGIKTK